MDRVRLLVMNNALMALDYRVPHGMTVEFGSVVVAPLGPRQVLGIVWETERLPGETVGDNRLRPLLSVLPVPPLGAPLRRLIEWTSDYYCAPLASVARMALSSSAALQGGRSMTEYRLSASEPPEGLRLTAQRKAAFERLAGASTERAQGTLRELAEIAGVTEGVLRGMAGAGLIEALRVDLDRPYPPADPEHAVPDLSDGQQMAADEMVDAVRASADGSGGFAPFLLDGVTGSGKTETYFEAVAEAIRLGRQVLVMLPEIALTQNFLRRFEARFGVAPVLW
ncbi:MAG TPA: DEAD/DEAH box helicase, partial [Novosphingobium sp.]|nr:DEAD/DEAH box helicase [Novosphingobium sp.]